MNMHDANPFRRVWALGYRRLVPIVPPDATISERSLLHARVGTKDDARGKVPGVRWSDGSWSSFNWTACESTENDVSRWGAMGAGVGLKLGDGLAFIDADTLHEDRAQIIWEAVKRIIGPLPVRIGRYPKAGYLVRLHPDDADDFQYLRVEFGERDEKGSLTERCEVLYEGRQCVVDGVHPVTRKPYAWQAVMPAYDELPVIRAAQIVHLLDEIRPLLPAASATIREGAQTAVNQETLKGDIEWMRRAVEATPNSSDAFPTREAYRDYGYAIKAATVDDPEAGFDLFSDWCARWIGGENEQTTVASDWGRMKPPFRAGASLVYEIAERASNGAFRVADATAAKWFAPITIEGSLFPEPERVAALPRYDVLSIADLYDRPDPKFVIDRHLPEESVGFLYGDPGTGKSFVALDWALHVAFDRGDWFGDAIDAKADATVIYLAGEGASGFKTRVAAWCARHGVDDPRSGRFGLVHESVNFMQPDDVMRLAETLRERFPRRVALIVVDTVSRSMPGADENLQKEMTLFVGACDVLKRAFRCVVLGVHHAGKKGDMRGSTVLLGAGDFVFKLERKKGASVGRLHCEKQKDAPDGWSDAYRFDVVTVGEGRSSLVPARCDENVGPNVELTPDVSAAVLEAMEKAWKTGEPWGLNYRMGERMAARQMVRGFGFTVEGAEELLRMWIGTGRIAEELVSKRLKTKGLRVIRDDVSDVAEEGENLFD